MRRRKARFRILLLRQAYWLSCWLPEEAVMNVRRIDRDPEGLWVRLTLNNGARLLDTGDRITVRGLIDDVAIDEMAECVGRRGWTEVEITGDPEFRTRMARELLLRGIEVRDCPLPPKEVAELRRRAGGFDWRTVGYADDGSVEPVAEPPAALPVPVPPWLGELG